MLDIEKIKERWKSCSDWIFQYDDLAEEYIVLVKDLELLVAYTTKRSNAEAIMNAPSDISALIDEIERLRKIVDWQAEGLEIYINDANSRNN